MVAKQKHLLDSLRQKVSKSLGYVCPNCKKSHEGDVCSKNDILDGSTANNSHTTEAAFLVDLISNHKIIIPTPKCEIGRDETNDIIVSGDQSISRHHLRLYYEGGQYSIEDNNSRHGTFLNGTQTKIREPINDGDVIKIGVSLFWFVIENNTVEAAPSQTGISTPHKGEHVHLNVNSDLQSEPADPSSCTMNEIPIMPNEQSLLETLRFKTRGFDQAGLFASQQSQSTTLLPQFSSLSGKSVNNKKLSPPPPTSVDPLSKEINMSPSDLMSGLPVYDHLMKNDLVELTTRYNRLKDEIDRAQKERQEIADQLNTIKVLGTSLIGGSDGQLTEACHKVFSALGWQIGLNSEYPQELQLKLDQQVAIARIISTAEGPERSHLGELSISQTRLWCDQGEEPKGILIINRLGNKNNEIRPLTKVDYESEVAKHAAKKNVCMMTSMQVLAIYRDLILKHSDANTLREKIFNSAGWLEDFVINP